MRESLVGRSVRDRDRARLAADAWIAGGVLWSHQTFPTVGTHGYVTWPSAEARAVGEALLRDRLGWASARRLSTASRVSEVDLPVPCDEPGCACAVRVIPEAAALATLEEAK